MRIIHVASSLRAPLGGAELYCVELAIAQARVADVAVATPLVDEATRARLEGAGVRVDVRPVWRPYPSDGRGPNPAARALFHALDAWGAVRAPQGYRRGELDADVVHVHRFQGVGAGVLRAPPGRPVLHTVHDYALVDTRATGARGGAAVDRLGALQRARTALHSRAAAQASLLIFPSVRTRDRNLALGLDVPGERVAVIPHGWPWSSRHQGGRRDGGLLFLGKLSERKGVAELLEAWDGGIGDARLAIAGAGPLEGLVREADGGVTALGWLDGAAKEEAVAHALALVMPSTWPENFPLVTAEAMLAGTPVLTNALAAGPLIEDGVNGLVAPDPSPAALRAVLTRFLADPGLQARLAAGARATAAQLDMDAHVEVLLDRYREALGVEA